MSGVSASSLATAAALMLSAGGVSMAADSAAGGRPLPQQTAAPAPTTISTHASDSRYEIPGLSFENHSGFGSQVIHGLPVAAAEWRVELYSDYPFTQKMIDDDTALPDTDKSKKFLKQLQANPWELKHRCGAVYIGDLWVLTAAHCINDVSPFSLLTYWRVRVGATDLALPTGTGTSYKVVRVIHNNKYVGFGNEMGNDIALIKIAADASTNLPLAAAALKSIRILGDMPGDLPLANMEKVKVSGWGTTQRRVVGDPAFITAANGTHEVRHGSARLLEAEVTNVDISVCMTADAGFNELITKSRDADKDGEPVICVSEGAPQIAGAPQADSCQGDSGGPLTRTKNNETVLVGLVSLGKGCGTGTPSIYTNVTYFRDWIAAAKLDPAGQVSRW